MIVKNFQHFLLSLIGVHMAFWFADFLVEHIYPLVGWRPLIYPFCYVALYKI